jgi:uncharacterized membrane protein
MIALRYVYVVALVVWVGGLITIGGVVAPSAFAVLARPSGGDTSAASVVGEVLRRFQLVGYVAGATLLATLVLMKLVGPRPPGFGVRIGVVSAMLALVATAGLYVDPQIAAMRAEAGGAIRSLARDDPRRARFGRLHGMSTALMAAATAFGLVLCYWETRE